MQLTKEENKKLLKFIKNKAYFSFKRNRDLYLQNAIELNDLKQDLYIYADKFYDSVIKEGKTKEDFWRLVHGGLNFECKNILKKLNRASKRYNLYKEKKEKDNYRFNNNENKDKNYVYFFEELIGKKNTEILLKNVLQMYTTAELSKEYNISQQAISRIINRSKTKLKKEVPKNPEIMKIFLK